MIEKSYINIEGLDRPSPWLIICDHASFYIPPEFDNLGISEHDRTDHMAGDIGAWALSRNLASKINAPLVGGVLSRLVVDLNRYPDDTAGSMPPISDGVEIKGNQQLTTTQRQQRLDKWFYPYHNELKNIISAHNGGQPKLMFVHSFTPKLRTAEVNRPWHLGFISGNNRHLTDRAINYFKGSQWCIGDNEPYAPINPNSYTLPEHAENNGLDYLVFEVRNDLIANDEGVYQWSAIIEHLINHIDGIEV